MKVGLTDGKEIGLGGTPRRIATKVKTGQRTNKGSQRNAFVSLIYLVQVEEEKGYWKDWVVMWKKIIKKSVYNPIKGFGNDVMYLIED